MMIERKVGKEGKCQLYLSESGSVEWKLVKGVDVRDFKLIRGETVSVDVGWRAESGVKVDENRMFLVDGQNVKIPSEKVSVCI